MSKALRDKGGNQIVIIELDESLAIPGSITNGVNALNCGLIFESGVDIETRTEKFKKLKTAELTGRMKSMKEEHQVC